MNPRKAMIVTSQERTNNGIIAEGAYKIGIYNSGAATATVQSSDLPAGAALNLEAPQGHHLPEIFYDATGTTLQITIISYQ